MRIVYIVFTFYILYLVSLPCADKELICNQYSHQQDTPGENHENQNEDNTCSPFCVCSCCNAHVVISNIAIYTQPPFFFQILDLTFDTGAGTMFSTFVWQPPKLG